MAQSISQEAIGATGLPGATAASRHAGATASGAPTTGTFAVGDFIVDQSGAMYVCTVAGTPGTWGIVGGNSLVSNVAGRNKIINGDFGIWQRGTTFNNIGNNVYNADRWITSNGNSSATINITRQSFTPGSAPVVGYESAYYLQFAQTVAGSGSGYNQLQNRIEDVRTFANQTVTFSFWALAGSGTININPIVGQCFGSGGSGNVELTLTPTSISVGSSGWVRYTATGTLPSIAGKTIGTGNYIYAYFGLPTNAVFTFNVWGVQLEAGSTATEFTTASGSIGGELALCQRYYQRIGGSYYSPENVGVGTAGTTTAGYINCPTKQVLRTGASFNAVFGASSMKIANAGGTQFAMTSASLAVAGTNAVLFSYNVASGLTAGQPVLCFITGTDAYIELNAEL